MQLLAWGTQTYAVIDWDGAVDIGLQNDRFSGGDAERARAQLDWGVAAADQAWPLPIAILAFVGLLRMRPFGFAAGLMELSVGVYWPLVFAFQRWSTHRELVLVALAVWSLTSAVGLVGLWTNRSHFGMQPVRMPDAQDIGGSPSDEET
jgi:hypothetical protein